MTEASAYKRETVLEIINTVVDKVHGSDIDSLKTLNDELVKLQDTMEKAKAELMAGREITGDAASDELDAVMAETAVASDTIMDSCAAIQEACESADEGVKKAVQEKITAIYEACSFQDITGQRIQKVMAMHSDIEKSIRNMLNVIGPQIEGDDSGSQDAPTANDSESLENGPQLAAQALSQGDIDSILASFDD